MIRIDQLLLLCSAVLLLSLNSHNLAQSAAQKLCAGCYPEIVKLSIGKLNHACQSTNDADNELCGKVIGTVSMLLRDKGVICGKDDSDDYVRIGELVQELKAAIELIKSLAEKDPDKPSINVIEPLLVEMRACTAD